MPRSRLARLEAKANPLAAGVASGPSNGRLPLKRGMGARRGASPCDTRRSATRASSHLQKAQLRFVEAGAGPALSIPPIPLLPLSFCGRLQTLELGAESSSSCERKPAPEGCELLRSTSAVRLICLLTRDRVHRGGIPTGSDLPETGQSASGA